MYNFATTPFVQPCWRAFEECEFHESSVVERCFLNLRPGSHCPLVVELQRFHNPIKDRPTKLLVVEAFYTDVNRIMEASADHVATHRPRAHGILRFPVAWRYRLDWLSASTRSSGLSICILEKCGIADDLRV